MRAKAILRDIRSMTAAAAASGSGDAGSSDRSGPATAAAGSGRAVLGARRVLGIPAGAAAAGADSSWLAQQQQQQQHGYASPLGGNTPGGTDRVL